MKCDCGGKLSPFREFTSFLFGIPSKHLIYKCDNEKCNKDFIKTTTNTKKKNYNIFWEQNNKK